MDKETFIKKAYLRNVMNARNKKNLHGQKTLFQIGKLRIRRERG